MGIFHSERSQQRLKGDMMTSLMARWGQVRLDSPGGHLSISEIQRLLEVWTQLVIGPTFGSSVFGIVDIRIPVRLALGIDVTIPTTIIPRLEIGGNRRAAQA